MWLESEQRKGYIALIRMPESKFAKIATNLRLWCGSKDMANRIMPQFNLLNWCSLCKEQRQMTEKFTAYLLSWSDSTLNQNESKQIEIFSSIWSNAPPLQKRRIQLAGGEQDDCQLLNSDSNNDVEFMIFAYVYGSATTSASILVKCFSYFFWQKVSISWRLFTCISCKIHCLNSILAGIFYAWFGWCKIWI